MRTNSPFPSFFRILRAIIYLPIPIFCGLREEEEAEEEEEEKTSWLEWIN